MWRQNLILIYILALISFPALATETNKINIPAGEFKMPAVLNQKAIRVKKFVLDQHPVTNHQYLKFLKENPGWRKSQIKRVFADSDYLAYWPSDLSFGDPSQKNAPVVQVSWFAALAYCESLGMRLPTIEEWEYVSFDNGKASAAQQTLVLEWYSREHHWPLPQVMKRKANSHGIYDLHGLIWEWVDDFNSSLVTGESRANGSLDKSLFCGAGASNATDPADYAAFMRYAFRSSLKAKYTVQSLGFRCAQEEK